MLRLSATRLTTYQRCPHAYYLRYHRRVPGTPIRPAALGKVLHAFLAELHSRSFPAGIPECDTLLTQWIRQVERDHLTVEQHRQGWEVIKRYYDGFIAPLDSWVEPIGVEGQLDGSLHVDSLKFRISGRYDRLDPLHEGQDPLQAAVHLIDYKMSPHHQTSSELELDLQLGLYQIAIDQVYGSALKRVSHIYLRTGTMISFETHPAQKALVQAKVAELADKLLQDRHFEPTPGHHCSSCSCKFYCPAVTPNPIPLEPAIPLQLSLL